MALGRAFSVAVRGLDAELVEIEADIASGLPGVHLVGLPDAALQESRDRVRAALVNCGFEFPLQRIVVNLAPASLRKAGPGLDLAISVARLISSSAPELTLPRSSFSAARPASSVMS